MTNIPATVLTSIKNECPYIVEFIAYYRLIGFNDILVVTNDNADDTLVALESLKKAGYVDYIAHTVAADQVPQRNGFRLASEHFARRGEDFYVYVADADEFLRLYDTPDIQTYLDSLDAPDAVSFNWKFYGSNGHKARPNGLVLESYDRRAKDSFREHLTLKSLFLRSPKLSGFTAHFPVFQEGSNPRVVYSDGGPLDPARMLESPHQSWSRRTFERAAIHHYGIKSWEEFLGKRVRGRGANRQSNGGVRHTDEYFEKFDNNNILDPVPAELIERTRAEMASIFTTADLAANFDRTYFGL